MIHATGSGRNPALDGHATERRVLLSDGRSAVLRAIRPTDAALLLQFHDQLSAESLASRFFGAPHLSSEEVRHLTGMDDNRRGTWVALDEGGIVAVGRYEPTEDAATAELGLIVDDRYQGVGLGSALLQVVMQAATEDGYEGLRSEVPATNHRMLRLLMRSGAPRKVLNDGPVTSVLFELGSRGT